VIDLEKIKRRLEMRLPDGFVGVAVDSGAQWARDIRALVAEVERLRTALRNLIDEIPRCEQAGKKFRRLCNYQCVPCAVEHEIGVAERLLQKANDLQPCGHPQSAIVSDHDLGGDCTCYCGMCNAKAEAEVRRDDRAMVEMGGPLEMREEEVRY